MYHSFNTGFDEILIVFFIQFLRKGEAGIVERRYLLGSDT